MIEKTTTKSTTIPRDLFSWGRYTYNTIIHSSRDLEKKKQQQQQRRQHLMCADITTTLYRYNSAIKMCFYAPLGVFERPDCELREVNCLAVLCDLGMHRPELFALLNIE
uniref:Uncharacterized protein n=1 Tax=Glossina austeni TaxID=7395 RepID=A0A1A9UQX5_GLOAU